MKKPDLSYDREEFSRWIAKTHFTSSENIFRDYPEEIINFLEQNFDEDDILEMFGLDVVHNSLYEDLTQSPKWDELSYDDSHDVQKFLKQYIDYSELEDYIIDERADYAYENDSELFTEKSEGIAESIHEHLTKIGTSGYVFILDFDPSVVSEGYLIEALKKRLIPLPFYPEDIASELQLYDADVLNVWLNKDSILLQRDARVPDELDYIVPIDKFVGFLFDLATSKGILEYILSNFLEKDVMKEFQELAPALSLPQLKKDYKQLMVDIIEEG